MRKQRTYWVETHTYPNGFIKAGVVKNTKLAHPRLDVIAYEEFSDNKYGRHYVLRHMTVDEALVKISALSHAVAYYYERNFKKFK